MVTIKHTRESIAELEKQREQFKKQRDELSEKLDKECNDNYKLEGQLHDMTKQRDSLIKNVEKLKEELRMHIQCNDELERVNVFKTKKLNREKINNVDKSNVIFKLQEEINKLRKDNDKYNHLTEHIKNKALHNPSVSRYIDLVHFIDDLERE
ncbi:hypothetical protein [Mammaliicoccus lentus]|uniref:hypothetical protein n=1 Tax=Mammaliicoccus lentus TaxID=42858 RepID=UPI002B25CFBA|nr:hypothetical protein [Mammaliicoccus lentus]WQK49182.1 hypothetical protein P3U54_09180 [Mammaliicoccus lentus]